MNENELSKILTSAFGQAKQNSINDLNRERDQLVALLEATDNLGPEESFYLVQDYFRDAG